MTLSIYISLFILGTIFGSFVNVIIYRVPRDLSIIKPGSYCTACQTPLKWYHNIPVISYIILKGKCAYCNKSYSIRYPIVELLTGLAFIFLLKFYNDFWLFSLIAISIILFIAIIFIDYEHYIIPDKLLVPLLLFAFIYFLIDKQYSIINQFLSALTVGAILYLVRFIANVIYKKEALGLGDVKLSVVLGFLLGWSGALLSIFLGFCIASVFILILMVSKKVQRRSYIPLGPFMIFGMVAYIFWGTELVDWYLNTFMK